ncbi:hypothetical protein H0H81_011978 [Sphagnurus paluster]|uniref:histidine kinase n=1 Tax=Sphagnurus paluster TaxID=117069 RepID=A0A9P7KIA0_9AGAR|nr:hypothetical protein H0H81_011978 [Sphagnurus paluster]
MSSWSYQDQNLVYRASTGWTEDLDMPSLRHVGKSNSSNGRVFTPTTSTAVEDALPLPVLAHTKTRLFSSQRKKKTVRVGGFAVHWAKFKRRVGTGTAPSSSSLIGESTGGSTNNTRRTEVVLGDDDETVDEVVVDRVWSDDMDIKTSITHSEHGGSPEKSGGSHPVGPSTSEHEILQEGFWNTFSPIVFIRWRLWPAISEIFNSNFADPKSEAHYAQENWFIKKSLALWASLWFILNWILGCIFAKPLFQMPDKIFYYGIAPAFSIPIILMVMYDWPRDRSNIYQTILTISIWCWSVRVPLNTALLAVQNMEACGTVAKEQEIEFSALEGSLSMMSKVLNDVLDFNRMDSGKFESVFRPYGFHQVMRSLFIPLRLTTNARGLDLEIELDPRIDQVARRAAYEAMGQSNEVITQHMLDHPHVEGVVIGDESRLRQIITNLASNACKFTPAGGKLSIKTKLILPSVDTPDVGHEEEQANGVSDPDGHPPLSATYLSRHNNETKAPATLEWIVVRIEVTDTGYGIRHRDIVQNKLFSAFNQTEQGRTQGGKGTGLGLALVRQIVKLSGGRLGVRSKVGQGSTFWVELPLGVGRKTLINSYNPDETPRTGSEQGSHTTTDIEKVRLAAKTGNSMPRSTTRSLSMAVDAAALRASQLPPESARSSSAMQSIMEQGPSTLSIDFLQLNWFAAGRVELVLQRHGSHSPVLTRTEMPSPEKTQQIIDGSIINGSALPTEPLPTTEPLQTTEPPSSTTTPKPAVQRPTYVALPSPQSFQMDAHPTSNSITSVRSDSSSSSPLAQFDSTYTRGSPSSSTPAISIEPGLPVLVVDDDPLTRTLMKRILTRLGCNVSTAENGEVALEMILGPSGALTPSSDASGNLGPILEQDTEGQEYTAEGKFSIVFLDNQMPVLSGLKAVSKLRELGRKDLIVGVTGNALLTDQQEYLEAGADRGLQMPHENSPPPSPPSPSIDTKLSRKREREVSLEPVSDADPPREHKETRTPAKKNRTQLATTTEEEDGGARSRSNSRSPPQSDSPPHEMKIRVRQISQGVEDINWRSTQVVTPDRDIVIDPATPHPSREEKDQDTPLGDSIEEPADSEVGSTVTNSELADAESGDKNLKRKFLERGTSQGPQDFGDNSKTPSEPLKRPRDDAGTDDNPRETKRPSPPPEPKSPRTQKKGATASTPKLSGFMAYASTTSPFAAVKGQNIFASHKAASPPPFNHTPTQPISIFGTSSAEASGSSTPSFQHSGFEGFASSTSPFASVSRSKSPILGSTSKLGRNKSPPRRGNISNSNAFSPYAGGSQSFAIPATKRARAGSPSSSSRSSMERTPGLSVFGSNGGATSDSGAEDDKDDGASFGAKLRAGKDEDDEGKSDEEQGKFILSEQDVLTGEEDEQTVHQVRGKLFSLVGGNQWKERGTGTLKLNVKREDGSGARLVMRKEAVYTLLLNVTLFPGMRCSLAQDPRYLRFSVIEEGAAMHYNLRLANAKITKELLDEINAYIPSI